MLSSSALQFDKMEVDTSLAQEYFVKNPVFENIGFDTMEVEHVFDAGNYKIHYSESLLQIITPNKRIYPYHYDNLIKLAVEIEKNINLFCQLEHVIRGKSIQATKLELAMIVKHLRYAGSLRAEENNFDGEIIMRNDSPIIDLGFFTYPFPSVNIYATEKAVPICYLFTQLCHKTGLYVNFGIVQENFRDKISTNIIQRKAEVLSGGCIGVVTAQADVDSAVEAFVAAPVGDVWGIRRVLVEESASERLRSALSWKMRGRATTDRHWRCTEAYAFEDKTFLREYVGTDTGLTNVVIIESFRTVKELLTLIESYSPFCVSLWSDSVAQSNEIAFGIAAPIVWVNDYGTLGEPYYVSAAYFSQLVPYSFDLLEFSEVKKLQKDWLKLTDEERINKFTSVIGALQKKCKGDEKFSYLDEMYQIQPLENSVTLGAKDMVIKICRPLHLYYINFKDNPTIMMLFAAMKRLLSGSGLIINYIYHESVYNPFLYELKAAGLPVYCIKDCLPDSHNNYIFNHEPIRIVHSNFGTIFAN